MDEGKEESVQTWLLHEHTQKIKREADKAQLDALNALLLHCKTSTDIAILQKYSVYERYRVISKLMSGEGSVRQ